MVSACAPSLSLDTFIFRNLVEKELLSVNTIDGLSVGMEEDPTYERGLDEEEDEGQSI